MEVKFSHIIYLRKLTRTVYYSKPPYFSGRRRAAAAAPHATGVLFPGVALQFPLRPPARAGQSRSLRTAQNFRCSCAVISLQHAPRSGSLGN